MKVRRLTVDVLYDEKDDDTVQVILDKMTTDWLTDREQVKDFDTTMSEPSEPDTQAWDYFWEYDSLTDTWAEREGE